MRYLMAGLMLFSAVNTTVAAQTTLPFTFAPGTVAKASEVNANFQALLTAINRLEGQISAADVAGTYSIASLGLYVNSTPQAGMMSNNGRVEHISSNGTATLNANGTFSVTQETTSGSALVFDFLKGSVMIPPSVVAPVVVTAQVETQNAAPPPTGSGTWSLSGKTLTLTTSNGGGTFTAAVGGRLFIGITPSPDNKSQDLHILIRTN